MNEMAALLRDRTTQVEAEAAGRRTAEENVITLERELNKANAKLSSPMAAESGEVAELKSFNEDLTVSLRSLSDMREGRIPLSIPLFFLKHNLAPFRKCSNVTHVNNASSHTLSLDACISFVENVWMHV